MSRGLTKCFHSCPQIPARSPANPLHSVSPVNEQTKCSLSVRRDKDSHLADAGTLRLSQKSREQRAQYTIGLCKNQPLFSDQSPVFITRRPEQIFNFYRFPLYFRAIFSIMISVMWWILPSRFSDRRYDPPPLLKKSLFFRPQNGGLTCQPIFALFCCATYF